MLRDAVDMTLEMLEASDSLDPKRRREEVGRLLEGELLTLLTGANSP